MEEPPAQGAPVGVAPRLPVLALAVAVAIASAAPCPAQLAAPAPDGAWVCEGGNPARTRGTGTSAPRRRPSLAWSYAPRGELVGEPLAWGERVDVEERRGPEERALVVLDRRSAALVGRPRTFETGTALAPSLWGDVVVVRAEPARLEAHRVGGRPTRRTWSFDAEAPLEPPLAVGDAVYVVAGDALLALRVGDREPEWTDDGGHGGPLAVRDGAVLSLVSGGAVGGRSVRALDAATGAQRWERVLAFEAQALGPASEAAIVGHADGPIVLSRDALDLGGARSRSLGLFDDLRNDGRGVEYGAIGLVSGPALWGDGWLGEVELAGTRAWLNVRARDEQDEEQLVLATDRFHADLLGSQAPPAIADGVAYLAGVAVDLEDLRVLWRLPERGAWIPVRRGLLVRADDGSLRAYLADRLAADEPFPPGTVPSVEAGWSAAEGVAVLDGGAIVRGGLALEPGEEGGALELVQRQGRRRETWPLAQVLLVTDATGALAHANGTGAWGEAIAHLAAEEARAAAEERASELFRTQDDEALAVAIEVCAGLGVEERTLERLEERAAKLAERRRPPDSGSDAEVAAALRELEGLEADRRWEAFEALPADAREACAPTVVEAVLDRQPLHAGARAWVAARLPEGAALGEAPGAAAEWLSFLRATRHVPIEILAPPAEDEGELTADQRALGVAKTLWREDLVGFRSPRMLVITPVGRPGVLAQVVAQGELMCDALDALFAGYDNQRDERFPLEIHLFESREEYLEESGGVGGHAGLEWTAGHFSALERVSRLFVPEGEDGFDRALSTFLHELTHHWVFERCPAFTLQQAYDLARSGEGFWVVEGFASAVEGVELDVDAWTWRLGARPGERVDLVANAPEGGLLRWDLLVELDQRSAQGLIGEGRVEVAVSNRLGGFVTADGIALFYAQSAALARYLLEAEDSAARQALLDYLVAYYTGDARGPTLAKPLGRDPEELGEQVVAWAREQVRGAR